jgi:hypothetical protein
MSEIKALVDRLHLLDITPLHLNIDGPTPTEPRPNLRLWLRTRTDFERACGALGLNPKEARYSPHGQRQWTAEGDTPERRLFLSVVSFEHHDDWQPKPGGAA